MTDAAPEDQATGDGAPPRMPLGRGRALVPVPPPAPKAAPLSGLGRSHGIVAAGVAVVMGLGFVAGTAAFASKTQAVVVAQAAPPADTTMDVLLRVQGEVRALKAGLEGLRATADDGRQADAVRGLKKGVDALKQDLEAAKSASAGALAQLVAKMDRLDRDPGPKLNEISARLDRLDRDPEAKAADAKAADARIAQVASQLAARIDRVERQVATADATGSVPRDAAAGAKAPLPPPRAAGPSPTAAVPAAPPPRPESARAELPRPELLARAEAAPPRVPEAAPKPATVDGWLLRDVYGGVALLEGRAGGLREVAPGEYVAGVGEIRSIERRGRGWVVVTSRGLIQAENRW